MIKVGNLITYREMTDDIKNSYANKLQTKYSADLNSFFKANKDDIDKVLVGEQRRLFKGQVIKQQHLEENFLKAILKSMNDKMLEALNVKIIKKIFKKDKELGDSFCNKHFDEVRMKNFLKSIPEETAKDAKLFLSYIGFDLQPFLGEIIKEKEEETDEQASSKVEEKETDTDATPKKHKQKISSLMSERDTYKTKLSNLQSRYEQEQNTNKQLIKDKESLTKDRDNFKKDNERLNNKVEELKEKIRKLKKDNGSDDSPTSEVEKSIQAVKTNGEKIDIDIDVVLDNLEDRTLLGYVKPTDIQIDRGCVIVTPVVRIIPENNNVSRERLLEKVYYRNDYSTFNMPIDETFLRHCLDDEKIKEYQEAPGYSNTKFNILFEALYRKILFFKPVFFTGEPKLRLGADLIAKPFPFEFPLEDFQNWTFVPHFSGTRRNFENTVSKHEPLILENYPASLSSSLNYIFVDGALYQINYFRVGEDDSGEYIKWVYNGSVDNYDYRRFDLKISNESNDKYVLTPSDDSGSNFDLYVKKNVLLQPSFKTTPLWDEEDFIYKIGENAKSQNLYYSEEDLKNFHVAIKSSNLVILAGPSGIGKTKLPMIYANTLGLDNVQNAVLFVPISPSYLEPEDVLGYIRPISEGEFNAEYIESQTGLVSFLNDAANNTDRIHLVVFDEMNLSQIEHWFAPFISLLEQESGSRVLKLYPDNMAVKNGDKYPQSIKIGENVFFVGTVNVDETTKQMSDRLLDRAIVVNLSAPSFESLKRIKEIKATPYSEVSFSRFSTSMAKIDNATNEFTNKEFDLINELNALLTDSVYNRSISFRSLYKMALFMKNSKDILSRNDAIDFVISQIVVKKINGAKEELDGVISDDDTQGILRILNLHSDVSKFTKTRRVIYQKIQEINKYGFTK